VGLLGGVSSMTGLPGGTSSRRNAPVCATPPETYGALSTQIFVAWKSAALRAASVSTVLYLVLSAPLSTSRIHPRTLMGSLLTRGVFGSEPPHAAATTSATSARCLMR